MKRVAPRFARSTLAPTVESPAHGQVPNGRSEAVLPRARAAGPRSLAEARRLPPLPEEQGVRSALGLLRGPADSERPARLPPRPLPGVQGHLPALPDHDRALRPPQGGLGLPRAAGGARDRARA